MTAPTTAVKKEKKKSLIPGMSFHTGYPIHRGQPWSDTLKTTKMESTECIQIFMHIHIYVANKKRGYQDKNEGKGMD